MQAYQSPTCVYCGYTWNSPDAQTCFKCKNPLPSAQPVYAPAGQATPTVVPATTTAKPGFYRSPLRTFIFAFLGSDAYLLWWSFQLLGFAQREKMPKSASPWWVIFPFMNFVYVGRAIRGIAASEKSALGQSSLPVPLVTAGYVGAIFLGRLTTKVSGVSGFVIDLTIAFVIAAVLTLVQRSANRYQAAAHPELGPAPTGMAGRYTWGEVVALIIGCILTLGLFAADLIPA